MSRIDIVKQFTTQYCVLRYKQEKALKAFKASLDLEVKDLIQNILEEGISQRNLDNHRTAFDKLIGTHDYYFPDAHVKTPSEKAEIIFGMVLDTISNNRSNSSFACKERYIKATVLIQRYFTRYFEIKNLIADFKSKQSEELSAITEEMKGEGVPLFIVKYVYKRLKADADLKAISPSELDYSDKLYQDLKETLMMEIASMDIVH